MGGCASFADSMTALSGVGKVTKEHSEFDGATVVRMTPAFLYGGDKSIMGLTTKLGAFWSSNNPEYVSILLENNSQTGYGQAYVGFNGLDVNIGGEKLYFDADGPTKLSNSGYNTVSQTIYTKSHNTVVMKLETLKRMVEAEDCRIRINTSDGFETAHFHEERIPGGQSTAKLHYKEFLAKIYEN